MLLLRDLEARERVGEQSGHGLSERAYREGLGGGEAAWPPARRGDRGKEGEVTRLWLGVGGDN